MIITIDGPSGTGKSTVARKVAEALALTYFDTGALYRALTWFFLTHSVDPAEEEKVQEALEAFTFQIEVTPTRDKRYFVGKEEVTEAIRSRLVTARVSEISALPIVRSSLLHIQQQFAQKNDAVFEGRDLGTVVFPQAEFKFFLTADPQVRAERRLKEILAKNPQEARELDQQRMLEEIIERDRYDSSRAVAPLKCPDDAVTIDTTHLCIDEVVAAITTRVKR